MPAVDPPAGPRRATAKPTPSPGSGDSPTDEPSAFRAPLRQAPDRAFRAKPSGRNPLWHVLQVQGPPEAPGQPVPLFIARRSAERAPSAQLPPQQLPGHPPGHALDDLKSLRHLERRQPAAQWARSSSAARASPSAGTTWAMTASPHSGSGRPKTAASATAGCSTRIGLDLGRRDVLAAGDDRVGLAAGDDQAPAVGEGARGRRYAASRRRLERPGRRPSGPAPGSRRPRPTAAPRRAAGTPSVAICEQASVIP